MRICSRKRKGSAIVETGPALFILLIFIIFPVMDAIQIGCGYAIAWFINSDELRFASMNPKIPGTNTRSLQQGVTNADNDARSKVQGLLAFTGLHWTGTASAVGATEVEVTTTGTIKPFLTIPYFQNVPGLGAPIPFTMHSQSTIEEQGNDL